MNATLTTQAKTPAASFKSDAVGLSQHTCACGGSASLTDECEECSKASLSPRRSAEAAEPTTRNLSAVSQIAGTQALPETRFGHDFGRVRVHDASNRSDDEEEACATCKGQHGGAAVEGEEDEFSMIGGNGDAGPGAAPDAGAPRPDAGAPPAVTASATTTSGPTFNTCGAVPRFRWCVNFTTSLRNGWLVQKIENTWNPSNCDGSVYGGPGVTPLYWEAWQVDGSGNVSPVDSICSPNANDRWQRYFCSSTGTNLPACGGKDSRGTWSMAGTLYAVSTLPGGFSSGGATDAGMLQSTTSDPGAALGTALSTRRIGGTWNCCAPSNTHTQT